MSNSTHNAKLASMSDEELARELTRLNGNLEDLDDLHAFTFVKTSVHIGAEKAQNMQQEYEDERRMLLDQIKEVETVLASRKKT